MNGRIGFGSSWVAVVIAAQVLAVNFDAGPPLQQLLSIIFVLTVPGFVVLDLPQLGGLPMRSMLAIAGSLSVNLLLVSVGLLPNALWIVAVGVLAYWSARRFLVGYASQLD